MGNNSEVYVCVTHTEAKQCGRKEWENGNWAMCWMVDLRVAIQTYESYALLFFTLFHAHIAPLHDDESNQKNANKFLHLKLCVKINGWKWIMCFFPSNFILLSTLLKHTNTRRIMVPSTRFVAAHRIDYWHSDYANLWLYLGSFDTRNKVTRIKNQMAWHDKRNDCHSFNSPTEQNKKKSAQIKQYCHLNNVCELLCTYNYRLEFIALPFVTVPLFFLLFRLVVCNDSVW